MKDERRRRWFSKLTNAEKDHRVNSTLSAVWEKKKTATQVLLTKFKKKNSVIKCIRLRVVIIFLSGMVGGRVRFASPKESYFYFPRA